MSKFAAVSDFDVSPNASEFLESLLCWPQQFINPAGCIHLFNASLFQHYVSSISIEVGDGFVALDIHTQLED